jgi:glycerol-3-phosphate dehydrogenase
MSCFSDLSTEKATIKSEIEYTIDYESAIYLDDYFNRRLEKFYSYVESVQENFYFIIFEFLSHFNWSDKKKMAHQIRCKYLMDNSLLLRSENNSNCD